MGAEERVRDGVEVAEVEVVTEGQRETEEQGELVVVGESEDDKLDREEGVPKGVWLEERQAEGDEIGVGEDKEDAEEADDLE